jgi:Stage II sporulation protein E (SpoIIE)
VSPFQTSRREARLLYARALAGVAVVCSVPLVVAAVTAGGPLTSAASGQAATPAPSAEVAPPPATDPVPAPEPSQPVEGVAEEPSPPPPAPEVEPQPEPVETSEPPPPPEPGRGEPGGPGPATDEDPPGWKAEEVAEQDEEAAPEEEPAFEEESAADEEPGPSYYRSDPSGWRFWRGVANLTGAVGDAGGGGREAASVAPGLSSPVPPPPLGELPAIDSSPPPLASAPSPVAAPAPAPLQGNPGSQMLLSPVRDDSPPRTGLESSSDGGAGEGAVGAEGPSATAGTGSDTTAGAGAGGPLLPAPATAADFIDPVGQSQGGSDGSAIPVEEIGRADRNGDGDLEATVVRPVERLVNNVPESLKFALAALGVLAVMLGLGYLFAALRARSLARQRLDLLQEVGLLQSALLPPVPEKLGGLRTSVAYRPADGPGAGGDFYDVVPLAAGGVGFILGDVSGHGRGALARTAFMRYTLRAYLEAGLEPRAALQVAGRVMDENLGGDFATVLLAVHDPETGSLTYATAGHPAPIVVGPQPLHPVTAGSSPPIGVGVPTGLRQTTVPLVPGSVAGLFTDGLMDARADGGILGRDRLEQMLADLGDDATAHEWIDKVSQEARVLSDDIAAVVVTPIAGSTAAGSRTEQLELTARELEGPIAGRFLAACGVSKADAAAAISQARALAGGDGTVLQVVFGETPRVEVLPRDVEGIEAASRRAAGPS